jgi:hypothetical protein
MKINHSFQINSLLKNDSPPPHFLENYFSAVEIKKLKTITNHILRENWFEMSDLFSSLLIITIIKTILSTFFTVSKFYKNLVKWALTDIESNVAGTTTLDREWYNQCLSPLKLWIRITLIARFTQCNIMWSSLSVTCGKLVVFSGYSGFLHHKNWPPRYNWNSVESGVKHHNPNPRIVYSRSIYFILWIKA